MKKFKSLLLILVLPLILTGCVKYNATMDIKKDKSMDFSIIYAFNKSLMGDSEMFSDDNKKELEKQGFSVSNYEDDNMKGYTIVKKINNIDEVSSEGDAEYSISGMLNEKEGNKSIFKVSKGFLKNKYTAKLDFSANDSSMSDDTTGEDVTYGDDFAESDYEEDNDDVETIDFGDYGDLTNGMDLSFNVNLPYKALSNNASNVEEDGKKLLWSLSSTKKENIEFEFELYNMNNVYILIGGGIALLVIVCAVVFMVLKKKNN